MRSPIIRLLHLRSSTFMGSPEKLIFLQIHHMQGFEWHVGVFPDGNNKEFIEKLRPAVNSVSIFPQGKLGFIKGVLALRSTLKKKNIQIIATHDYKSNLAGKLATMGTGVRQVAIFHGTTEHDFKGRLYEKFDRWVLGKVDAVVVVSRAAKSKLSYVNDRVLVVHNSFDWISQSRQEYEGPGPRQLFDIPKNAPLLLHVGRLSPEKNQEFLIQAFLQVLKTNPEAFLVIVGDGPERKKLELLIEKIGLLKKVWLAGHQANVDPFYREADLFVLCSQREGLPLVLLEAASHALPVVSTSVGGVPEFVENSVQGFLVEPGQMDQLVLAIERLLQNPPIRNHMGRAALLKLKEQFSPEKYAQSYSNLYRSLVGPSSVFISWEVHRRTREMADALSIPLKEILFSGPRWMGHPWRFIKSCAYLLRKKPRVLFVQSPSIFLASLAMIYKFIFKATVVVDAHNESVVPYEHSGQMVRSIVRWMHSKADWTVVTNGALSEIVKRNGGRPLVMPDRIPSLVAKTIQTELGKKRVVFICTFAPDEPYAQVIKAAEFLSSHVEIFITGNFLKADPEILKDIPANVRLTGFVDEEKYVNLLSQSNLIIDLTEMQDCLVCGAYEAVALGKPLLTSDTLALREHFRKGTLYTKHSVEALVRSIRLGLAEEDRLEHEMNILKQELKIEWEAALKKMQQQVFEGKLF